MTSLQVVNWSEKKNPWTRGRSRWSMEYRRLHMQEFSPLALETAGCFLSSLPSSLDYFHPLLSSRYERLPPKNKPIDKINVHVVSLYSATSPVKRLQLADSEDSEQTDYERWVYFGNIILCVCVSERDKQRKRERAGVEREGERERDRVLTAGFAGDGDDVAGAGAAAGAADGAAAAAFSVFSASAGFVQLLTRLVTPPLVTGTSCKKETSRTLKDSASVAPGQDDDYVRLPDLVGWRWTFRGAADVSFLPHALDAAGASWGNVSQGGLGGFHLLVSLQRHTMGDLDHAKVALICAFKRQKLNVQHDQAGCFLFVC